MISIKRTCFVLMMYSQFFGCAVTHQNLVADGTYQIEPIAVPNGIHVHTRNGQTEISGNIEALANGATETEGMLRLEVIGPNGEAIDKREVCFSPPRAQEFGPRFRNTIYREPQFSIVLSKIHPAGSTFRFTLVKFTEECLGTNHQ